MKLNQNTLKIIAVIAMTLDHIGVELFPGVIWLRVIGRLAFPLFSFFIFEGFYYTGNRRKYFLQILLLGVICSIVYFIYTGMFYGNIFLTFSVSLITLRVYEWGKTTILQQNIHPLLGIVICMTALFLIATLTIILSLDYGVMGVMLPLLAAVGGDLWEQHNTEQTHTIQRRRASITLFSIGLLLLSVIMRWVQPFCLCAIPLLLLYDGTRGRRNLKAFFYWYYPLHLGVIGLIGMFL